MLGVPVNVPPVPVNILVRAFAPVVLPSPTDGTLYGMV